MYAERLARLWAVENGLCFGRLDQRRRGTSLYIGRIGLTDDEQQRLLIDWRAPVAQPFYGATPAASMGVTRRRHLQTKGRNGRSGSTTTCSTSTASPTTTGPP